jgi:hypothetical protein
VRTLSSPVSIAVTRCVGHAVATTHVADHSLGSAWYIVKPIAYAEESMQAEQRWKDDRLPNGLWNLEGTRNGTFWVNIEKKGFSSKWIACRARRS